MRTADEEFQERLKRKMAAKSEIRRTLIEFAKAKIDKEAWLAVIDCMYEIKAIDDQLEFYEDSIKMLILRDEE